VSAAFASVALEEAWSARRWVGSRLLGLRSRGLCLVGATLHFLGRGVGLLGCVEQLLKLGPDLFQTVVVVHQIAFAVRPRHRAAPALSLALTRAGAADVFKVDFGRVALGFAPVCAVAPLITRMNALNHNNRFIVSPFHQLSWVSVLRHA
jgi:hypothetical protein